MKRRHFEELRPTCPVCRLSGRPLVPLGLEVVVAEEADDVIEGILRCPSEACRHEYPILDGIPIIVPQLRDFVAGWSERLRSREPFSDMLESLLGDCCGSGSAFEDERQRLSSYAWDHWGEFDPDESSARHDPLSGPGAVVRLLETCLAAAGQPGAVGPVLDAGCAVGRTTLEIAARCERLTLGIDLDVSMLRVARQARDEGQVRYPRRRVGLVYDRREFDVSRATSQDVCAAVDFWCCDATVLPFADATFSLASSLNLLDCVGSPLNHLQELVRILAAGGHGLVGCPYDWSAAATPLQAWLGGHSQRGAEGGSCETLLRDLLTPGRHPSSLEGIRIVREWAEVPWQVRLHQRATMLYRSHVLLVERTAAELPQRVSD